MAQRLSNAKTKITGVRIHKPRADSSIASVSMDQYELIFPHLPGLLQDLGECSVENDLSGMIAVKVDLHHLPPGPHFSQMTTDVSAPLTAEGYHLAQAVSLAQYLSYR